MPTILILIYIALTIVLVAWVLLDVAFENNLKRRGIWWMLVLLFPALGSILYFQKKQRRIFNPKFTKH